MSDLVIYNDGELELDVSIDGETIWLRQDEIALIFNIDRTGVTRHINKILKDKEIEEKTNVQKMHFANFLVPNVLVGNAYCNTSNKYD